MIIFWIQQSKYYLRQQECGYNEDKKRDVHRWQDKHKWRAGVPDGCVSWAQTISWCTYKDELNVSCGWEEYMVKDSIFWSIIWIYYTLIFL